MFDYRALLEIQLSVDFLRVVLLSVAIFKTGTYMYKVSVHINTPHYLVYLWCKLTGLDKVSSMLAVVQCTCIFVVWGGLWLMLSETVAQPVSLPLKTIQYV